MKNFFISRHSLLLFCVSLATIFTTAKLNAQLNLYAEADMNGQQFYAHPEGDLLAIPDTKASAVVASLKVSSGYQVTLFAEANYTGPSMVFSTGEYAALPPYYSTLSAGGGAEGLRALRVGSYKLEHKSSDEHIDLWYASNERGGQIRAHAYNQRLEEGTYTLADLIGTPSLGDEGELWPKLSMNSITVPRGFVIKITNTAGKSISLVNDDKDRLAQKIDLNQHPKMLKGIAKIEVMEARYRVKSIQLTSIEVMKMALRESVHVSVNGTDTEQQPDSVETFQDLAIVANNFHGAKLSVSAPEGKVRLDVKGEALGSGNGDPQLTRLFEESTIQSIVNSISDGHVSHIEFKYDLQEICSVTCPPNSECETTFAIQPENIIYDVVTTLERISENGQPVANSTITVTSNLKVHESKVTDCTTTSKPLDGGLDTGDIGELGELGGLGGEANIPDSETMLPVGTKMVAGDRIWSPSKSHYAIMQPDGNLCVYTAADGWVWCNMSQGQGNYLVLQDDGNMCVYTDKDRWVWGSQTHTLADKPVGLSIDDSGTLYLQDKDGNQVWKNR